MISAEEIKALMANKKTRLLMELAKASKHYGKEFVYTATNESELLSGWSNVQEATYTSCKKLNIVDLVQELSQELELKLQAIHTLQTLLNQAAEALDTCDYNPRSFYDQYYFEEHEVEQALAAIEQYIVKEGE